MTIAEAEHVRNALEVWSEGYTEIDVDDDDTEAIGELHEAMSATMDVMERIGGMLER